MIRIPAFLKPGDRVALISPSRFAEPEQVAAAQAFTKAHGYELVEAPGLGSSDGQLGGTDAERAAQLNWALAEPSVRAVWGVRGGYGAVRAVDHVDWSLLERNPKWLIGFSDFTVLLSETLQHQVAAMHGPMAIQLARNATPETFQALADALRGAPWTLESPRATEDVRAQGPLVGGNLSVLYSLLGSASFPDLRGCILALEDLDEYHYHLDRMMQGLCRAGVFDGLTAVVAGDFSDLKDHERPFGRSWSQILRETVPANIPVVEGFGFGHENRNLTFVHGLPHDLSATSGHATLRPLLP
ncbi:MAG: S66 peptidase family protein [Schleiferiaceae bacterium]